MSQGSSATTIGRLAKRLAKQYGPWLVAILAMVWVSRAVRWSEVGKAFEHARLGWFIGVSVVFLILNCAADSMAMYYTFRWFGCHVPYRELYIIRAATYLLAVVQYYVGQAAILGFLRQRNNVPLVRGAGWILFISGINMGVLVLIAAAGLVRADIGIAWLRLVPPVVGAAAIGYAILLHWKPARLANWPLLAPMFEMGVWGHVKATVVRMPHILVLVAWHFIALRYFFHVRVPPLVGLVYLPAVFFFAALPVSVQGLGLSQWAAVTFFAAYATAQPPLPRGEAAVLAYSLAMTGASLVIQVSMGLGFLRWAQKLGLAERTALVEPATTPLPASLGAVDG